MLADFVTGTGNDTGRERDRLQLGLVQPDVGACLSSNVAHGEFVKNLTRSSLLEARLTRGWRVCRVLDLKHEGEIIRHAKVRPVPSNSIESEWIAVEDGRIAPLGTHISQGCISIFIK